MHVNPSSIHDPNSASTEGDFFAVRVARKEALAGGIYSFELHDAAGKALPGFTAGAHLTVQVPSGVRRNYSLCSAPQDTGFYKIAVKRDSAGRGGSISMVDDVHEGDMLAISALRNNFELHPRAQKFLFVAGGIGITPILSMMRHLKTVGNDDFRLIYCTRDAQSTAFLPELTGPQFAQHVQVHHDQGDINNALDFWPVFETPTKAHVYCCGPKALMESVADMTGHWPSGSVHFESFGVDASTYAANTAFTVHLQKTGTTLAVAADQTILQVLRGAGLRIPSSCESGTCGSCKTTLLAGEAEHRDMVLSNDEKTGHIMVCVSRAKSPELVLDL
jgi:phthalate 4,5-dioxygenase reductase subunit